MKRSTLIVLGLVLAGALSAPARKIDEGRAADDFRETLLEDIAALTTIESKKDDQESRVTALAKRLLAQTNRRDLLIYLPAPPSRGKDPYARVRTSVAGAELVSSMELVNRVLAQNSDVRESFGAQARRDDKLKKSVLAAFQAEQRPYIAAVFDGRSTKNIDYADFSSGGVGVDLGKLSYLAERFRAVPEMQRVLLFLADVNLGAGKLQKALSLYRPLLSQYREGAKDSTTSKLLFKHALCAALLGHKSEVAQVVAQAKKAKRPVAATTKLDWNSTIPKYLDKELAKQGSDRERRSQEAAVAPLVRTIRFGSDAEAAYAKAEFRNMGPGNLFRIREQWDQDYDPGERKARLSAADYALAEAISCLPRARPDYAQLQVGFTSNGKLWYIPTTDEVAPKEKILNVMYAQGDKDKSSYLRGDVISLHPSKPIAAVIVNADAFRDPKNYGTKQQSHLELWRLDGKSTTPFAHLAIETTGPVHSIDFTVDGESLKITTANVPAPLKPGDFALGFVGIRPKAGGQPARLTPLERPKRPMSEFEGAVLGRNDAAIIAVGRGIFRVLPTELRPRQFISPTDLERAVVIPRGGATPVVVAAFEGTPPRIHRLSSTSLKPVGPAQSLNPRCKKVSSLVYSKDGKQVAFGCPGWIEIRNLETFKVIDQFPVPGEVEGLAIDPKSGKVAFGLRGKEPAAPGLKPVPTLCTANYGRGGVDFEPKTLTLPMPKLVPHAQNGRETGERPH